MLLKVREKTGKTMYVQSDNSMQASLQGHNMIKKTSTILMAAAVSFAASGIISAAGFESDLDFVREQLRGNAGDARLVIPETPSEMAEPDGPPPGFENSRWWSVSFFGSGHKASTKAALKVINKSMFPDIAAAAGILKHGSNDESGHLNIEMNGGPVKEIWFGDTPFSQGGVIANYTQFKFEEAYARLGTVIHLTQDQAVPMHAANIHHGISDTFENAPSHVVKIRGRRDNGDLEPYEYYQVLQNETRSKLPGWTDPETGLPYWELPADAPSFGQDVTYGPWGHYGGKKNRDTYARRVSQDDFNGYGGSNNTEWFSLRPEIRLEQLSASGEVSVSVMESASKRLPPLVKDLSISPLPARGLEAAGYQLKFSVYDNRTPRVTFAMSVYRAGELVGDPIRGAATLFPPKDGTLMFSGSITSPWDGLVNFQPLQPGTYTLDLRVTDEDGNITPDLVNADSMPGNDTKLTVVIE